MKKYVLVILIFPIVLFSQVLDEEKVDDIKELRRIYSNEFSRIVTGNTFLTPGNYAAVSTANNNLTGSFFIMPKNNRIINFEITAGATQGIATIFDEGQLNSNVSIGGSYLWLGSKNKILVSVDDIAISKLESEISKIEFESNKELLNFLAGTNLEAIEKEIKKSKKAILDLEGKLKKAPIDQQKDIYEQLNKAKEINEYLCDEKKKLQETSFFVVEKQLRENQKAKKKEIQSKIDKLKPEMINMDWFSIGYVARNSSFKLVENEVDIQGQLRDADYTTHSFIASYSFLKNAEIKSDKNTVKISKISKHFVSFGVKYSYTNNLSSLTQVEVLDQIQQVDSLNRTIVQKQNAFSGDYIEDISEVLIYIDYYQFLSKADNYAIHLIPSYLIRDFNKPVAAFQFGVLLPFKNKDKTASSVNVEFFYRIKDVFNTTVSDNSLLNRNIVGFQIAFPITF